jgi:hypothetical protein
MKWLSSPKVRLALIVNGLYFISLFTPTPRHGRPHLFAHARVARTERAAPYSQPTHVPLAPPNAVSRATAYESGGMLHVSLSKDLRLVQRPGRQVLLSPSFSARTYPPEEPSFVLLNFIIYADKESCAGDCPLTITADGGTVWTSYSHGDSPGWQRERVPHSSTKLEDGRVVETVAAEALSTKMSYEEFIDMISAKRVIVRLGPDWAELTHDQIEALRDMHRRLPQSPAPGDSDSY